ncbi:MAG: hypothetical protein EXR66_07590 [Dehalococcoidia bacterium]|nr:hypothetical protein [Dehalococcoidia bacterium]
MVASARLDACLWPSAEVLDDPPPRAFIGLILVALGGLFLADEAGLLDTGGIIGDWWPLVIVAVGAG